MKWSENHHQPKNEILILDYIPESGSKAFGVNFGLGVDYEYNRYLTFEIDADYHTIFDKDVQFLHAHTGLIFRF